MVSFERDEKKVAFARSIVHNPDICFDEPTADVSAIRDVHDLLWTARKRANHYLSSHTTSEVEKLCDKIGIIHKGQLAITGTIPQLTAKYKEAAWKKYL